MTNTKDEAKPSETPEKPASNKQENDALPNTEKNDRMNTSRNRSMWGNQNPKCDINSETRHVRTPSQSPNGRTVSETKPTARPLFVHLSDIHFNAKDGVLADENTAARRMLLDDLRQCVDQFGAPDAVLVTGDISFSGKGPEYEVATEFLERVTEVLGIERAQVQVVPGNHDVDRSRVIGSVRAVHGDLRGRTGADLQHALEEYLLKDPTDPLFATMEEYQEFATQYQCNVDGKKPFWDTFWRLGSGATLVMRGLTTSLVSNGGEDKARLVVGTIQTS